MKQVVPDALTLRKYIERRLTQEQMVDAWEEESGVRASRSAIAMAIKRYDLTPHRRRKRYADLLPWEVKLEHRMHNDARMLRLEGRRRSAGVAEGVRPLDEKELRILNAWLEEMDEQNAVIAYNPNSHRGFWRIPRSEGEDLIRVEPLG